MPRVYVSIGSNIDRERNIRGAVRALRQRFGAVAFSRVYESPSEGFAGDPFFNLVAAFDTDESPEQVRKALAVIEDAHGRVRGGDKFCPRTLDLDLLLYGDLIRHKDGVNVPRDEIGRYAFVLGPLAELAPAARHPETGECYGQMWEKFSGERQLRPVTIQLD